MGCGLIACVMALRVELFLSRAGADMAAGSGRSGPVLAVKPFTLAVGASVLLAAMVGGCATPPYVQSLDTLLDQKINFNRIRYQYMCTAGAHRGASVDHRENTLAALKAADRDDKYAFIEFDVQYSKDGRIVVYHDKRMLRLFRSLKAIGETDFSDLAALSNGEIVTYDQVMAVLKKKLNIEIKSQGDLLEDQRLVDEIVADIRRRDREKDVLISSISGDVVKYVSRKYPEIPTGQVFWLTSSTYLHFDQLTQKLYEDIDASRADYLMLHVANLRNIEDLIKYKPKGKTIVFWDFDDTIFIVHKDASDRLWGHSGIRTYFQLLRFKLASLL